MIQKFYIVGIVLLLLQSCTYSQSGIEGYINSFPLIKRDIIQTSQIISEGKEMSKDEALKFIYNGDTNKLYCIEEEYDMITEKVQNRYVVEKIPEKCGKIVLDSIILVFYTTYNCQEPRSLYWQNLYLSIYDQDFRLKENFLIHRESEYDVEVSGLLNIKTRKFFRYFYNSNSKTKDFQLYSILDVAPYLYKGKSQTLMISTDNLFKTIKEIGWEEEFGL